MKKRAAILITLLISIILLSSAQIYAQEKGYQITVNPGMYERLAQEAVESTEGLSAEELARFFSQNLTLSSLAEEPIKSRLIILFMDGKGNVIRQYGLDAEELTNRGMRLGRLMSSSQIAGIMRESVPSTNWIPGTQWLSDNAKVRSIDELERVAGQMAIKWESPSINSEFEELFALGFALAPSGNEYDQSSPYLSVFPLYAR